MIDLNFAPGDIVKVYQKIKEDSKIRTQIFEGTVLKIRGRGEDKTFTVRKIVADVAVERIWPLDSPSLEKVAVKSHPKKRVRRAKLTYLRKS
ncbi:MAG: 50S ribosomal protein L19 [Candidatus Levybacteria bacterium RIFCSPLOWO2_01_FULL_38_13]|nr:MAG: 50S ribosomal protein L19 [Candidatus Levybacteria bacterium RIFCSPHIGHO2_01_FULL_41_15]OGH35323.1 MAG: 50S ribosomal protein L19 [Candidatus Levybacteria bacterium RIFCSPLOWO2_01_FULL_38_13]